MFDNSAPEPWIFFVSVVCCVVAKEAKRRANGEGNLRKRKDGRWEGRYTAGHDPETGKAIYRNVLGRTQAEARTKLKQAIEEAKQVIKSTRWVSGWTYGSRTTPR